MKCGGPLAPQFPHARLLRARESLAKDLLVKCQRDSAHRSGKSRRLRLGPGPRTDRSLEVEPRHLPAASRVAPVEQLSYAPHARVIAAPYRAHARARARAHDHDRDFLSSKDRTSNAEHPTPNAEGSVWNSMFSVRRSMFAAESFPVNPGDHVTTNLPKLVRA